MDGCQVAQFRKLGWNDPREEIIVEFDAAYISIGQFKSNIVRQRASIVRQKGNNWSLPPRQV